MKYPFSTSCTELEKWPAMKRENHLNELKGNLFEYLVGHHLARQLSLEAQFLENLPSAYHLQLMDYERSLRLLDPQLFLILPQLAEKTGQFILDQLSPSKVGGVLLIGKITHPTQEEYLGEADIIIKQDQQHIPLSLKLCKHRAYVNTKNAGIQSFLSKYFSFFHVEEEQLELSHFLQDCYFQMGFDLYQEAQIPSLFPGLFDDHWKESGHSELPGELPPSMRDILRYYYSKVIGKIYQLLHSYWEKDSLMFLHCLRPLCGLARPEMVQVICFHGEQKLKGNIQRYSIKDLQLWNLDRLKESMQYFDFPPLKKGLSSFELQFKSSILQIRVKPMNKFTASAPKINCSVKFLN